MSAHPLASLLAQCARLASGVTTYWIGCEPQERQRIYFANHTSHLDALVVWSSLPGHIRQWLRPVAAADYWSRSRLRRYLACALFNVVLIERSEHTPVAEGERVARSRQLIGRLVDAMGSQHSLILFPEGTRGRGDEVAPFKSGLYYLSQARPDVELVPVYISNLNRVLPKGEVLLVPLLCSVSFGRPLTFQPGESKQAFLTRSRQALCDLGQP